MQEQWIAQVLREAQPGSGERVLVAVINNPCDLERADKQGWYRIPLSHAPPQIGADYLALYLTGAFPPEQRHCVSFYAPIYAYRIARRLDLLPQEVDHPHAQERYFKLELGPLRPLDRPIPSRKLRRITFISTTLPRLLNAQEINDLWDRGRGQDALWAALRAEGISAERQVEIEEQSVRYVADFVIAGPAAPLIIICTPEWRHLHNTLYFSPEHLENTPACLRAIHQSLGLS